MRNCCSRLRFGTHLLQLPTAEASSGKVRRLRRLPGVNVNLWLYRSALIAVPKTRLESGGLILWKCVGMCSFGRHPHGGVVPSSNNHANLGIDSMQEAQTSDLWDWFHVGAILRLMILIGVYYNENVTLYPRRTQWIRSVVRELFSQELPFNESCTLTMTQPPLKVNIGQAATERFRFLGLRASEFLKNSNSPQCTDSLQRRDTSCTERLT